MNHAIKLLFTSACQHHQDGQLPQAIGLYEQLLSQAPHHRDALRFLGIAYVQFGDIDSAITYFEQALALHPMDADLHADLANAYKNTHVLDKAIHHYQQAIQLEPQLAQAHNSLATLYASQDNFQQALKHYRSALHAAPDFTAAHYNLGLLLLKQNELAAAQKQFNNVITLNPEHLNAQFYLGALSLDANLLDKAELAFNQVLTLNSEHVQSLTNLGVIALKRDHGQLAIDYFTRALTFDQDHTEARNNLAATFMHHDRFENALMHYDVLLRKDTHNTEYLYNMGVAQMALGHLTEATTHFETTLTITDKHFAALNNLAAIQMRLGHRAEAVALLKRALIANPNDEASQFMLHALTGDKIHAHACPDYAKNLFNNYALYYEQHMQSILKYTLPQHIARVLHKLHCLQVNRTIDLGCGTGLSGVVLRESSKHLIGVDIASKMLAQAKEKGIYDELIEAELITFLKSDKHHYDLAVAADVLPYLGDLEPLFSAIHPRLSEGALFILSSEVSTDAPWQLQNSVRFSHHPDYIQALCTQYNMKLVVQEKIVARQQNGQNLEVMLYCASFSLFNLEKAVEAYCEGLLH